MKTTPRRHNRPHATAHPRPGLVAGAALTGNTFSSLQPGEAIPATWEERATKAWAYFLEEPLVSNCVNAWRIFAVGDEVRLSSGDEDLEKEARDLAARLNLTRFVKDMVLQLLVKGDAIGFRRVGKTGGGIEEVVCVNPVSVQVKYEDGVLTEALQMPEEGGTGGGDGLKLPVEQVLHLKWNAPAFSPRGNSMVLPAFESLELLRDYRKAERAIAKRWTTPFRLVKVGGTFGQRVVNPDQRMIEELRRQIAKMDLRQGLVVPYYVTVETHGTDGQVLNVEEKVKEVKEDIMVALGLSRSLVTGDGPNFATASVSLKKMLVLIQEIKQAAKIILHWVFDDWRKNRSGKDANLQFLFNDLDPSDTADLKKLLLELYDRKLISRASLQLKMDLDPETEEANRTGEKQQVDLLDEKQIKPVVDLVAAGILGIEAAQKLLGIDPKKQGPASGSAEASWGGPSAFGDTDALCDDCQHFDGGENWCPVREEERTFDQPACRYFDRKSPSGVLARREGEPALCGQCP